MIVTFFNSDGVDMVRYKPDQYTAIERPAMDKDRDAYPHLWAKYQAGEAAVEKLPEADSVGDDTPGAGVPVEQAVQQVGAPPKRKPGRPKKVDA